jgi:hypothetical protein
LHILWRTRPSRLPMHLHGMILTNRWWRRPNVLHLSWHISIGKRPWHRCTNTTVLKPLGRWSSCKHCVRPMLLRSWVIRCQQPLCQQITMGLNILK